MQKMFPNFRQMKLGTTVNVLTIWNGWFSDHDFHADSIFANAKDVKLIKSV